MGGMCYNVIYIKCILNVSLFILIKKTVVCKYILISNHVQKGSINEEKNDTRKLTQLFCHLMCKDVRIHGT